MTEVQTGLIKERSARRLKLNFNRGKVFSSRECGVKGHAEGEITKAKTCDGT